MRKMMKRTSCAAWTAVLLTISANAERPNVLFIAVDDLKPILGCYGDSTVKSPNIDRLASQGTAFLNNHCQQAVCGPSRASLLTGLLPDKTKVWDLQTLIRDKNPDILTLPQHFRAQGYETAGIGKIFDPRSVDEKLDEPSWSIPFEKTPEEGEFGYLDSKFIKEVHDLKGKVKGGKNKIKEALGGLPVSEALDVSDESYSDGLIANRAMEMLSELSAGDKPFFLAVGFKKPHLPFVAPKKYWDLYEQEAFAIHPFQKMPEGAPDFAHQDSWELKNGSYRGFAKGESIPETVQKELIHGYHACVSYMDAQVGKLLDKLGELGLRDNTIVILWGDHGWHLGDHDMWCKHSNYEQATRAPLIISAPGMKAGQKLDAPVEFLDVFPTLCALGGLTTPEVLDGADLTPMLQGTATSVKEVARSQFPRNSAGKPVMGYAYRSVRFRYVAWVQKDYEAGETSGPVIAEELYDYKSDPMETTSQVQNPKYAAVLGKMREISGWKKDDAPRP